MEGAVVTMKYMSIRQKRRSMKKTLAMSVFVIHVIVLVISLYISYSVLLKTSSQQSINDGVRNLEYMEFQLESLVSNLSDIQQLIMQNKDISRSMDTQSVTSEEIEEKVKITNMFNQIINSYQYINSITLFRWDNLILNVGKQYNEQYMSDDITFAVQGTEAMKKVSLDNNLVWGGEYKQADLMNAAHSRSFQIDVVSLLMPIIDIWSPENRSVISINIPKTFFDFLYSSNVKSGSNVYLIDSDGEALLQINNEEDNSLHNTYGKEIVKSNLSSGNFVEKYNGESYQVIYIKNSSTGWYLVEETSFDFFLRDANQLQWTMALTFTIAILVVSFLSFILSSKMLVSYKKIAQAMNDIGEGNLSKRLPNMEYIELDVLTEKFNSMMGRIEDLIIQNKQYENEKRELEISTLQAQINPHFIYNSLTTIKWMASMARANNVCQAILALNNVLQPVFSQTGTLWAINSEINFVQNYIDIMNYRFGGEIHSVYDIGQETKNMHILRFILQPIVENSISHGLRGRADGVIRIEGAKINDSIITITVHDNGKGIDEDTLESVRKSLMRVKRSDNAEELHGFGLYNVNRRIKLHYGDEYGLEIHSVVDEGTISTITLPLSD